MSFKGKEKGQSRVSLPGQDVRRKGVRGFVYDRGRDESNNTVSSRVSY